MAPKGKARAVVKKTKKVVEETVQVDIIDDGEKAAEEIAMGEGMDTGEEARDEVTRTTVIIRGDGQTEEVEGHGKDRTVEIPIESQNFEEPVLVTPRKEAEKKGAEDRGTRETEKRRKPGVRGEREKEQAEEVEEQQENRAGEGVKGVIEEKQGDEVREQEEVEGSVETGEETEEPGTEKGNEEGEPEEGLVKTPEKQEIERDKGVGRGGTKSKKRRGRRTRGEGGQREQYKRYVYRVMKQVHPDLGISSAAMEVLNAYMNDMFERLADEAAKLSRYTEKKTLSSREVQSAVRLVLPGELGRHAIAEGAKAVTNYMSYDSD